MNSNWECSCCPPMTCAQCMPSCSSNRYVRISAESPQKNEFICNTRNCNIFGGHDTNPIPEYKCKKKRPRMKNENVNSLGSPIGLAASNVNFKTEGKGSDTIQARYATNLKAFARLHLNSENTWDSLLVEDVMREGLSLFAASQKREESLLESPTDIYMPHEQNILREFKLNDFTFHIELMPKFKLNETTSSDIRKQDRGDGVDMTLEDIVPALKQFFRHHKYALVTVSSFYVFIWRSTEAYFVFDACGRRISDFQSDKNEGVAMLMCFRSLENIKHLINNLSGFKSSEPLIIRELKLVKVITPNGDVMQQDYGISTHQYEVVNDDYAYLKSNLHLTLNRRDLLRNRSSLPVAVTAIVVTKIEHPATWDRKILDRILCFGVHFCQSRWLKCKTEEAIDITEFPTYFSLGQFNIVSEILAHQYKGIWRCVPDFIHSELAAALREAFDKGYHNLILQINYQMYAIWRKHDFIYLLDPYRHRILGKQNDAEIYEKMEKTATVRMFRSFDIFMNVFNYILLDSNRTSPFVIHIVKVKNIQLQAKGKEDSVKPIVEPKLDDNGEILSINEHICFEEAENLCQAALGEISDYEDEELKSDVDEIELRTSSSEPEDLLEEEEEQVGQGESEEIKDIESSSSGDEDAGLRKPSRGGRGVKKTRTQKRNNHKKHGTQKTKKDQGTRDKEEHDDTEQNKQVENIKENEKPAKIVKRKRKKPKTIDKTEVIEEKTIVDIKKDVEISKETRDKIKNIAKKEKKKKKESLIDEKEESDKNKDEEKVQDKVLKDHQIKKGKKEPIKGKVPGKEKDAVKEKATKEKQPSEDKLPVKEKELFKERDAIKEQEDKDPNKDKTPIKAVSEADQHQTKGKEIDKTHKKDKEKTKKDNYDLINFVKVKKDFKKPEIMERKHEENKPIQEEKVIDKENEIEIKNKDTDEDASSNKENEMIDEANKVTEKVFPVKEIEKIKSDVTIADKSQGPHCPQLYNDGTEADDENDDYLNKKHYCSIPNPNSYPGYFKCPLDIAIVGSESGSYESICKLFQAGFKQADRLLSMTPWGNFVIFRCGSKDNTKEHFYFLFDGCTCNFDRFRHLDLSVGTAGLICFKNLHNLIEYIRHLRKSRRYIQTQHQNNTTADDICKEYCNRNFNLRL